MKIKYKLMLPVTAILVATITATSWLFISYQIDNLDQAFEANLSTIAITSARMEHSFAERFAQEQGLQFHQVVEGSQSAVPEVQALETEVLRRFQDDAKLPAVRRMLQQDGESHLYVYVPARLDNGCSYCHGRGRGRIDLWPEARSGDLVGIFGVSGSTAGVVAPKATLQGSVVLIAIVVLLVISLTVHYVTRRFVTQPVDRLGLSAERVADGDLRMGVPVQGHDELTDLGHSFNRMVDKLNEAMHRVHDTSTSVATASMGISTSAERMANGAQDQSSQTNQVAAAVEEMSATILENSRNSAETSETARQAKAKAEEGAAVVRETTAGMERIAEVVRKSATTVNALGESTAQIGKIVSVIDEIADQTNLLALNAAIEAARAGEQGRGFAVVADEVRALAERTSRATKEIAEMIRKIQEDTGSVVHSMQDGTQKVDEGIVHAEKAGEALQQIVFMVDKVTGMIVQIATASEEQSVVSEQIARNVEEISVVTQETAGASTQVAGAAEDLNQLTENLKELVARFQLGDPNSRDSKET